MQQIKDSSVAMYRGCRYMDVLERNIQNGGSIIDFTVSNEHGNLLVVRITTSYIDGMTIMTDKMVYKDDILVTWELISVYGVDTIFSRDLLDHYKTKHNHSRQTA